jgi:tetratricopeptide (TPR) repeat protein
LPSSTLEGASSSIFLMQNPMMQRPANDTLLFRARLFLEEGQSQQALAVLETIQPEDKQQQREVAYLLGWYYVLNQCWDAAIEILLPVSQYPDEQNEQIMRADRERHARCLLHLGYAAINIDHYEEAAQHLNACLRAFQHKQLQRPSLQLLRIQACYSLAMTYNMRGLYSAALHHYEEALRLFLYVEIDNDEELGHIYYGLCDTYRKMGQLTEAQLAGEKALQLYEKTGSVALESRMHNQLGRVAFLQGQFQESTEHYTKALAIAASLNSTSMVMVNCTALADLRLAEGRVYEAERYCQLAQGMSRRLSNHFLCGLTFAVAGKVALAKAQQAQGEQKQEQLEEAMRRFEIAYIDFSSTDAYDVIAQTLTLWAQAYEASGRSHESLHLWKSAYRSQSSANGFGEDGVLI